MVKRFTRKDVETPRELKPSVSSMSLISSSDYRKEADPTLETQNVTFIDWK